MNFSLPNKLPKNPLKNLGKLITLLLGQNLVEDDCELTLTENPNFQNYYNENIKLHVKEFESNRILALHNFRNRCYMSLIVGGLIVAASIIALFAHTPSSPTTQMYDVIIFLNFMVISGLIAWCSVPIVKYKSSVKAIIFPKIFNFFGPQFQYSEKSFMSVKDLEKSHLIPNHDNYKLEDYIKGAYNDVDLELTESWFTQTKGSGRNRRTVTVFHGLLIKLSMNKKFSGQTVLKKDRGTIMNFLSGSIKNMQKVHLEDPVFEDIFNAHSTDQVEARYILTVSFMERLIKLADLYSKEIECSFYDSMLVLKIPVDHDLFETASIFEPATFEHSIKTIIKEMEQIFAIIDILKLNMNTGL